MELTEEQIKEEIILITSEIEMLESELILKRERLSKLKGGN